MNRNVDIIGVQMDFGASKRGVSMGPTAIRFGGLVEGLVKLGYNVNDKGDLTPLLNGKSLDTLKNYEQVVDIDRRLYFSVKESFENGCIPVILGGDHSVAAGSISAAAKHYGEEGSIGVIWIDAHGDWNNEDSTNSGNMHGMPFSAICGYGPNCLVDYGQDPVFVPAARCVQIGGRDIEPEERTRMKAAGITVFSIQDVDRLGMSEVINRAISIASDGTAGIHLSFDVDAITPESAPGTGTTVHSGLTVREAFLAVETIAESGKLISMDMVEVNPILDICNKTGILASEMILSAFGKTVF